MKNKIKKQFSKIAATLIVCFSCCFQSCDFLDIDPYIADLFTLDTVFKKKEYTEKYLNNIYSYLVDYGSASAWTPNSMPYSLITDEGIAGYKRHTHNYNYFCNNEMKAESLENFDRWDYFYEGIRKANTFILRVNECQEVSALQRSEWMGEAKFIKANLYFELMLAHGPIPIVPDEPVSFDTPIEQMMLERNTWDECNDYVSNLLEESIKLLPYSIRDNSQMGKPTKASAMAVLSRLTLYTASPLYNGQNSEFSNFRNEAGIPYLNPEKNMEKWAIAAANAKRLLTDSNYENLSLYTVPKMENTPLPPVPGYEQADFPNGVGGIDPYHSYADMFNGECVLASTNLEILFSKQNGTTGTRYSIPGMIDGWGVFFIPQSLVDAYYMVDGRDISDASDKYPYENGFTNNEVTFSGAKDGNGFTILSETYKWYVNREMRFYATIGYNNSYYPSTSTPPDKIDQQDGKIAKFYRDSKGGKDYALNRPSGEAEEYPMTGYLCRKFVHYEDSYISGGREKTKYTISYRLAEVYMNYVEAMNELDQSYTIGEITVSRDVQEIKKYFNRVRYRVGLPGITDADVANVERMRELIERERRIEFAWESRRYHDLRRTKRAIIFENAPITGCDVDVTTANPEAYYNIIQVKERNWIYKVFTNRQTFLPIPKREVDKNRKLDQMPGF